MSPLPHTLDSWRDDQGLVSLRDSDVPVAVIFPVSHAVGVSVIRTLEAHGIPMLALDFKPQAAGLYSNKATPLLIPDLYSDQATFERTMLEIGASFRRKPVLFLVDDDDLFLSLKQADRWQESFHLPLSPWSVVGGIVDKGRMYRRLQDLGWSGCPRTWFVDDIDSLRRQRAEIGFPCIIKPTFSSRFRQTFGIKAKRFDDYHALDDFAQAVFAADIPFVVQEYIPGPESMLVTYAAYSTEGGEVLASFTGRKLHQFPPDFGTCRLGESIHSPELEAIGAEFLKLLGYRGISLSEFKWTPEGKLKIIELNPRPGDWPERLADVCGSNLVLAAYRDTLGMPVEKTRAHRYGIKWAHLVEDFYYCVRGYRLLGYPQDHRGFFGWLRDLRGLEATAFFSWSDPWPAWVRFKGMLADFRKRERQLDSSQP